MAKDKGTRGRLLASIALLGGWTEAAARIGVSERTLRRWARGALPKGGTSMAVVKLAKMGMY